MVWVWEFPAFICEAVSHLPGCQLCRRSVTKGISPYRGATKERKKPVIAHGYKRKSLAVYRWLGVPGIITLTPKDRS